MKSILAAFVVVAFVASAAAADAKIDGKRIVGKWEITKSASEGTPKGAIVEFTKDGKVAFTVDINGKKIEVAGTYEVKDDKFTITVSRPDGSKEKSDSTTIKSLSGEKLITIDNEGKETELTRKK